VAFQLKRRGITRVRPLRGGFAAWAERGFPMEVSPHWQAKADVVFPADTDDLS